MVNLQRLFSMWVSGSFAFLLFPSSPFASTVWSSVKASGPAMLDTSVPIWEPKLSLPTLGRSVLDTTIVSLDIKKSLALVTRFLRGVCVSWMSCETIVVYISTLWEFLLLLAWVWMLLRGEETVLNLAPHWWLYCAGVRIAIPSSMAETSGVKKCTMQNQCGLISLVWQKLGGHVVWNGCQPKRSKIYLRKLKML